MRRDKDSVEEQLTEAMFKIEEQGAAALARQTEIAQKLQTCQLELQQTQSLYMALQTEHSALQQLAQELKQAMYTSPPPLL